MPLKALPLRISLRFQKVPLRLALVTPFLLQISAAVGLTGYLSFRNGEQAVNDVAQQLRVEIGDRIHQTLSHYLEAPRSINRVNVNAIRLNQLNLQNTSSLTRQFWNQRFLFDSDKVSAIYWATATGEFFGLGFQDSKRWEIGRAGKSTGGKFSSYSVDSEGNPVSLLTVGNKYDPRVRPWYKKAVQVGQEAWSDIYLDFKEPRLKITLVQPIYTKTAELRGVAGVDFVLSHIQEFLQRLKIGKSGLTFIMERSGTIVASSTAQEPFLRDSNGKVKERLLAKNSQVRAIATAATYLEHSANLAEINSTKQFTFDIEGKPHFLQITPLKDSRGIDWLIAVIIPKTDFMEQINANTRTTIWLCLGALVVSSTLGIFTSRWIVAPILLLGQASRKIASGKLDQNVEGGRIQELEILAQSFNQMATQLRESFLALETAKEELEQRVIERTTALQLSEEKFSKAFHCSPQAMSIATFSDGRFIEVNDSFLKFSGYSLAEIIGRTSMELHVWAHAENRVLILQMLQDNGTFRNLEVEFRTKSGERKIGLLSAEIIDINGTQCILAAIEDITARKQAEEALRKSEAQKQAILLAIPDLMMRINREGYYVDFIQPKYSQMSVLKINPIGQHSSENFPPDLFQQRMFYIHRALETREVQIYEQQIQIQGELLDEEIRVVPLDDNEALILVRDITERKRAEKALELEREKSEQLLLNILPQAIAEQLKREQRSIAEHFTDVTILFADIVGFTPLSAKMQPLELVNLLNEIFSAFDQLSEKHGLEKIKTIGDAYMVVGGLPVPRADHAEAVAAMALDMQVAINCFQATHREPFQIRIGINTGQVVAGVIGIKKFIYDLWGDTVNVASRMESQGVPGCIQVTAETYLRLKDKFIFEERGAIAVKGKGDMTTYWLKGYKVGGSMSPEEP
jgi:PAS domain S-box-containing protein